MKFEPKFNLIHPIMTKILPFPDHDDLLGC
jgi:hypothetical protein